MTIRSLTEDFERMGLSKKSIRESLGYMMEDADDVEDDMDLEEDEDVDEDDPLAIIESLKKIRHKKDSKSRARRKQARMDYKKNKSEKLRAAKKYRKSAQYRRSQKKPHKKGFMQVSSKEFDGQNIAESLMENVSALAEAVSHDPAERHDGYVDAFNHIADIGELLALTYHEMGKDKLAEEAIRLAIASEGTLEEMEALDGVVDIDEDAQLGESLEDAMEAVAKALSKHDSIMEDLEEDEDIDDEDEDLEEDEDVDILAYLQERKTKLSAKKAMNKKGKGKAASKARAKEQKGKKSKLSAKEKKLFPGLASRKDVRDPEALAGWLARYTPPNWGTGKKGKK